MSEPGDFTRILAEAFAPFQNLLPAQTSELLRHYELLVHWNRTLNLTSVSELGEMVLRHYCESLFLGLHLPAEAVSVLDVGSGAGFPGIPAAILRPDCRFTLCESHQRKAVFLREATRHLPNVRVAATRAEDLSENFDWVVSRAVKWRAVLALGRRALSACPTFGLLLGQEDAGDIVREVSLDWRPPVLLPWGERRVLVIGRPRSG